MRDGSTLLRGQGCNFLTLFALGLLAEAEALAGHSEDALALIDSVLADVRRTGVHVWDAELHRLRGEILGQGQPIDLAASESDFGRALECARRQKTKMLELRAALALANLYRATGSTSKIKRVLEPVLVGFDQSAETREMVEANALLSTLRSPEQRPRPRLSKHG
jgi:predicted ATPase